MDFKNAIPIYLQVMTAIKHDIICGRLMLGEKMPSVRDLAIQYTINPNTAGRVYKELEAEGVCFTKRGMGTFVTEDKEKVTQMREEIAHTLIEEFLGGMKQLGISAEETMRLIEQEKERLEKSAGGE